MTDEHINENVIGDRSDEYWYSNVSKKTPRVRFFLSLYRHKLSDSLLSSGTHLGAEKISARTLNSIFTVYRFPL